MAEQSWHEARLIPTSGINGPDEQERRATSALLAVLTSVREYGRVLLKPCGAPVGTIETYIEVPFLLGDKKLYPDGLIRVSRGSKSWTALVEVKTASNKLATDQLENYLDVAREQGFDALITISNEIPAVAGQHPTQVDRRKLKKVELHHIAWTQVLAEAVMQKEFRGVADPDQAWILGELIRYLEHKASGAMEFTDMGERWTSVRDSVAAGTLRPTDKDIVTVVSRFDALLRFTSLRLGRRLGTEVVPVLTRRELADPALRAQSLTQMLCDSGQLAGAITIPGTIGQLVITADLRASRITCHTDIDSPREGRPTTRVNWLVRQLKNAPASARIECFQAHARGSSAAELLSTVRVTPASLVADPARDIRMFRVAAVTAMGTKRNGVRGSFIQSVLDATDEFYAGVLQDLKAWSAAPPKMRPISPTAPDAEPTRPASLSSTDFSSQDGPATDEEAAAAGRPQVELDPLTNP